MKNLKAAAPGRPKKKFKQGYETARGRMFVGKIEDAFAAKEIKKLEGKVNLILTSPPFPLVRKKRYGNKTGEAYVKWLAALAPKLKKLLAPNGSLVIELGNAWVEGAPIMSTLTLEALLAFKKAGKLNLCQHVICHNPARLPSPAAWVNVKRVRLKDTYTHVWWMARSQNPKADNRKVLTPYGKEMKKLLKTGEYNAGKRPSGHVISETGFLTNHGGSITANVLDFSDENRVPHSLLKFSGTAWDAKYREYCESRKLVAHPARMQADLVAFFIEFLTEKNDLVFDPFGGSNTTGAIAENLERKWVSVEASSDYVNGSKGRFRKFQRAPRKGAAVRAVTKKKAAARAANKITKKKSLPKQKKRVSSRK